MNTSSVSDEAARLPWWVNYGAAVVIQVALTAFLKWLYPYFPLGDFPAPYAVSLLATVLVFGLGPAIVALALSLLSFYYFFVPHARFAIPQGADAWTSVVAYVLVTSIVVFAVAVIQQGRRRAERLAESLQEHAQLLDLAHVLIRDPHDRIVVWNSGVEALYGYSKREAIGSVAHDLLATVFPQSGEAVAEALDKTGHWQGELVHTAKDGSKVVVASHQVLHRDLDGNPVAIIEVDNDITGLKQAQRALEKALRDLAAANEELRQSQERSRLAYDAANSGTWEWDLQTNENVWSEELWRLYGLEPYSCEPSYEAWRRTVHPDDLAMAEQAVQEAAAQETELNVEYRVLHRDGAERWLMSRGRPILDTDGQAVCYTGIVMDITDRKRAEEALLEVEAHKRDFYRQTILAATEGKLVISEREEIEKLAGKQIGAWEIGQIRDIGAVRTAATALAREAGIDGSRVYDFMGCVVESIGNAVKHAHGGRAALYRQDDRLLFVVSDSGPGIGAMRLPDVALTRGYTTAGTLGMGYKVMINLADRVYLATGPEGTTVALEMALHAVPAAASAAI